MITTQQLIRQLTSDARPVRRLRSPLLQAALWIGAATVLLTIVTATIGMHPDLDAKLREPMSLAEILAAAVTGVAAAIAAFLVALPDRSSRCILLPAPSLLVWLSTIGYGCATNWIISSDTGSMPGFSLPCLAVIVLGSVPTAAILFFMQRHARFVRPVTAAGVASMAVAGLTVSALRIFHDLDASIMVLIWNVGAAAVMTLVGTILGRYLLLSRKWQSQPTIASSQR